jgi:deazaflavin-dependent oxidoreductase (nitroreductase family)
MPKTYRLGAGNRLMNRLFVALTRMGLGRRERHILTVRGRKSGEMRSTPVDVISTGGERWLVAGYGVSAWVHNLRAAREATLSRRGHTERIRADEVAPEPSVEVLRSYLTAVRVVRPYFDARAESPDEAFLAEVPRHPVFKITSDGPAGGDADPSAA